MKILIIDDEAGQRRIIVDILKDAGYQVDSAENGLQALKKMEKESFPLVLTDLKMPEMDGQDLLVAIKKMAPQTQVVLMTAFGSIPSAVQAIREGAYDYLTKPFEKGNLLLTIRRAAEKVRLVSENRSLRAELQDRYRYHNLIGRSPSMSKLFSLIERIKDIDATVLIRGESGTGKEMVARAIHYSGKRANGPFIALNCGAIPENLIESELFGHEKGAFSGAYRSQTGKFELAQKGTLFLDEISTMRLDLQVRLLRVLQEKQIRPLGSNKTVELDVRIVAASNENLNVLVENGKFRADLFHRLNMFDIHLAPLRERREDIPLFVKNFSRKFAAKYEKPQPTYSPAAISRLEAYPYPGNVRELEHIVEKTIIMLDKIQIDADDLMLEQTGPFSGEENVLLSGQSLPDVEYQLIVKTLKKNNGSITKTSADLGVSYKTLQYRIKKYAINKEEFR